MQALHALLQAAEVDMTLFFRALADVDLDAPSLAPFADAFYDDDKRDAAEPAFGDWLARYAARAARGRACRRRAPRAHERGQPAATCCATTWRSRRSTAPRRATTRASHELLDVMRRPYDEQPGREAFAAAPPGLGARPRRLLDAVLQLLSTHRDPSAPAHAPDYFNGLVVALVATLVAGLLRWSLDPLIGDRVPFPTFFIAIVVAVRFGGFWSAVLTMLLGMGWALLFWFPGGCIRPRQSSPACIYLLSSLAIIALGRKMHYAEALARGRAQELQDTVLGLRASQGRLQLATEVSGIGVFEWDIRKDRFTGENPEAYRIFGRTPDEPKLSLPDLLDRHLHPTTPNACRRSFASRCSGASASTRCSASGADERVALGRGDRAVPVRGQAAHATWSA